MSKSYDALEIANASQVITSQLILALDDETRERFEHNLRGWLLRTPPNAQLSSDGARDIVQAYLRSIES